MNQANLNKRNSTKECTNNLNLKWNSPLTSEVRVRMTPYETADEKTFEERNVVPLTVSETVTTESNTFRTTSTFLLARITKDSER